MKYAEIVGYQSLRFGPKMDYFEEKKIESIKNNRLIFVKFCQLFHKI